MKKKTHDAERKEKQRTIIRPSGTRAHMDQLLNEALEETFPASDPVAIDVGNVEAVIKEPVNYDEDSEGETKP